MLSEREGGADPADSQQNREYSDYPESFGGGTSGVHEIGEEGVETSRDPSEVPDETNTEDDQEDTDDQTEHFHTFLNLTG
ncbi:MULTISPECIES: hypothetical protein [Streptomyces]|uniref:hypothetical protein n=1 Tax=Streptomyces TaxID=1883 RepID=UPI00131E9C6C|nr:MULTISPECIES: hypothetical protein [Streptomyces]MDX2553302.1 hypothetical protein [Streptomyces stelliscabiei]MDX2637788.1 hypothetical protein [Streptomyces stelliscabiei]MDX2659247.1 hypothetical protein [Streptomyces stelliscabiei]MDX2716268.1 hypothetical protein [Streptomyces stelliscabiei]MDX2789875.1 hypothetical protein [Streptomyces stelliscabiei]